MTHKHAVAALGLAAILFSAPKSGHAQQTPPELPTEPILRIEAGQHTGQIQRIDTDAANKFVVTASWDKTVRVWSLPDGRLEQILRLPIGDGYLGQAFAVAISPDGGTIAVGGWTGTTGHHNIFLFDRASGTMKQRLSDLPRTVAHLAYSPDGNRLVASFDGIRVFDAVNGYRLLPSDEQYGAKSYGAHFDRAGRLVTVSNDGYVRLYAADRYAAPAHRWKGRQPYAVAFSPDGSRVAVGDYDPNNVVVLSGSNLTQLFKANMTGIKGTEVRSVGWSEDGRFLYAGGLANVKNSQVLRRWSNGGRGTHVDIPAEPQTAIVGLIGLKSGAMLVGKTDGLEVVDPAANVRPLQGYGALRLDSDRAGNRLLQVSTDGGIVQVDADQPRHAYRFALADRIVKIDAPADDTLNPPIKRAPGLDIINYVWTTKPAVNGTLIRLETDEVARNIAIVPGTLHFVLATEFSLRLVDQTAHNVWPNALPVPGTAWHVNAPNQRLVVAAYNDRTIRWHRLSDGKELLAVFIHPDGQRWGAWTPQGYYDASVGADELIGWHINHGYDRVPDFYPVSQFRDRFYRPDVIQRILQTPNLDVEEAVRDADEAAGRPTTRQVSISSLLTPVVQIHDKDPKAVDRQDLDILYTVRMPYPGDSLRIEAKIDGVTAPDAVDQRLSDTGENRAGSLKLTIPRRDSLVSVMAYNANGASEPARVHVQWRGRGTDPKVTLYVLAIGVGDYKDKGVRTLNFAGKDADDFVSFIKTQVGGLYENIIPHRLRDSGATHENILNELDWISREVTNSNNVAMVFLAGHGVMTPDQHYAFLPYDYDPDRLERTTISDFDLSRYLSKIGGKKIFFFDTCYSGAVLGGRAPDTAPNVDKFANELKAADNGTIVFMSSTGKELSQEAEGNGAFTKAVIEGLRGEAGRPEVPVIMTSDLDGYISRRVKELTKGKQKPMRAMPHTVEDFPISVRLH
jgi:WD40 repeat protein